MRPELALGVELTLDTTAREIEALRMVIRAGIQDPFHRRLAESLVESAARRLTMVREALPEAPKGPRAAGARLEVC